MCLRVSVLLLSVLVVAACSRATDEQSQIDTYAHALSPDGEVSALVYHYDSANGGLTQVSLDFVDTGCGAGSAAWYEYDIGIHLRWIDAGTLEVTYPDDKRYEHNASGDLLGCYDRAVRVVMVPRRSIATDDGAWSKPVESRRVSSPDSAVSAYTFRYDSPPGGVTQVIVDFSETRGCADSAVTFYDSDIELNLEWIDTAVLAIRYPDGNQYDHPPWGTTIRCVEQVVQVQMQPT